VAALGAIRIAETMTSKQYLIDIQCWCFWSVKSSSGASIYRESIMASYIRGVSHGHIPKEATYLEEVRQVGRFA
jgi:hypothetical protein